MAVTAQRGSLSEMTVTPPVETRQKKYSGQKRDIADAVDGEHHRFNSQVMVQ